METLCRATEVGLACVFLVTGLAKITIQAHRLRRLAIADIARRVNPRIGDRPLVRFWRGLGLVEVVVGLGFLSPRWGAVAAAGATSSLLLGLGYLFVALRIAPARSCGCFGTTGQVGWHSVLRCVYVCAWSGFVLARTGARSSSAKGGALPVLLLGLLIVLPVVGSLDWRGVLRTIAQRMNQWRCYLSARAASPGRQLARIQKSSTWRAMAQESGATALHLVSIDTWLEGNWRMWELGETSSSGKRVVAGRYLGSNSGPIRLMLFEGPIEAEKSVGLWDSRLIT